LNEEQKLYGGSKSTFTYAWKPSQMCIPTVTPEETQEAILNRQNAILENNIMILAGHYGNERLFTTICKMATTTTTKDVNHQILLDEITRKLNEMKRSETSDTDVATVNVKTLKSLLKALKNNDQTVYEERICQNILNENQDKIKSKIQEQLKKYQRLSKALQNFIDTAIDTIKFQTYYVNTYTEQPWNIENKEWEIYEAQVLGQIDVNIQKKIFFEIASANVPQKWETILNANAKLAIETFQNFDQLSKSQTYYNFNNHWWSTETFGIIDKNLQHFKKIKELWSGPSQMDDIIKLTCAKEFLYKLYTDIKSLSSFINIQEMETLIDSVTRHELEVFYSEDLHEAQFKSLEDSLWTQTPEFLDVCLKLSEKVAKTSEIVTKNILKDSLQKKLYDLNKQVSTTKQPTDTEKSTDSASFQSHGQVCRTPAGYSS